MEHLYSQQFVLQQQLQDFANSVDVRFGQMKKDNSNIMTAVRRIAIQPVVRRARGGEAAARAPPAGNRSQGVSGGLASGEEGVEALPHMCPKPPNLFVLWKEYEHGIDGQKPVKDWLPHEKAPVRTVISRRKILWDAVDQLVKRSHTSDTAIDKIYEHYGKDLPVNRILLLMRADKKEKKAPFFDHLRA